MKLAEMKAEIENKFARFATLRNVEIKNLDKAEKKERKTLEKEIFALIWKCNVNQVFKFKTEWEERKYDKAERKAYIWILRTAQKAFSEKFDECEFRKMHG